MAGFVYIMSNPAFPERVKIGKSDRDPEEFRKSELHSTGVPEPFKVEYYAFVQDHHYIEKVVHQQLDKYRPNAGREFFTCAVGDAISIIQELSGNTLKYEENNFSEHEEYLYAREEERLKKIEKEKAAESERLLRERQKQEEEEQKRKRTALLVHQEEEKRDREIELKKEAELRLSRSKIGKQQERENALMALRMAEEGCSFEDISTTLGHQVRYSSNGDVYIPKMIKSLIKRGRKIRSVETSEDRVMSSETDVKQSEANTPSATAHPDPKEAVTKETRQQWVWPLTWLIWGGGIIYFLWNSRIFVNEAAESTFGFVLYIVAFFYVLAMHPIRSWVDSWLGDSGNGP